MTVAQMIEWLKNQPQENEVVIRDADTGWFLPAETSPVYDFEKDYEPKNSTVIYTQIIV